MPRKTLFLGMALLLYRLCAIHTSARTRKVDASSDNRGLFNLQLRAERRCLESVNLPAHRTDLPSSPVFSSREFRDALGQFATGVTIITACSPQGAPVGLTVSSFNAVSLTPPLVLWSLGVSSSSMEVFSNVSHYAIHVLAADQKALAERFARKGVDRFAGLTCETSSNGVPLLPNALATFECRSHSQHAAGDHVIFIGEVEQCRHRNDKSPLLYHGGALHDGDLADLAGSGK
jgi:flavin reductase (DIM6/NTAB) family NADH-FMN oxidoreductase RutF